MAAASQQVNTHLLVYTKRYATEQLERYLRHSITNYFKFLRELAEQDARTHAGTGKFKKLVLFQHRCNDIQKYDEEKENDVVNAIVRDKSAPIDSLLKTILLANSMIIGSFGQTGVKRHKIKIPSRREFVMCCLKFAAKSYFTNPVEVLASGTAQREIVNDAIAAAIQDMFPFEELVGPIVNQHESFHPTGHDQQFAEKMVSDANGFTNNDVEQRAGQYNTQGPVDHDASHPTADAIFAQMPQSLRPRGHATQTAEAAMQSQQRQPPSQRPDTHRIPDNSEANDMYEQYIAEHQPVADDTSDFEEDEDEGGDESEDASGPSTRERQPRFSRLDKDRDVDYQDSYSDESDEEQHAAPLPVKRIKSRRREPPQRMEVADDMGFMDSD